MINELKSKTIKKSLPGIALLLIAGIAVMVLTFGNFVNILKGHVAFETLKPEEISNQIVDVKLTSNMGAFIEEYEENKKTGYRKTTHLYYVIWTGADDDYESEFKYMAIRVPVSYKDEMEAMMEATINGTSVDPIEFSGAIKEMDSEDQGYFSEYFESFGLTTEDINEMTIAYYIDVNAFVGGGAVAYIIFSCIGILLVLLGIYRIIFAFSGGYMKKMYKQVEGFGHTESEANWDYEASAAIEGTNIRIGKLFTYSMAGGKVRVIPNDKLVWTYFRRTTHRTNGIKTGTSYEVVFVTLDKKTILSSVSNEEKAIRVLQYITDHMPRVVVGYTEELNKMFRSDFNNFLAISYYNPEKQDIYAQMPAGDERVSFEESAAGETPSDIN